VSQQHESGGTSGPVDFTGFVQADRSADIPGYFDTGTNTDSNPIRFSECANGQPTQAELDRTPDYLPDPSCITISGTYYPSDNTWEGNVNFPISISERTSSSGIIGEVYSASKLETQGAVGGTLNRQTGEMTIDMTVDINTDVYNVDSHGVQWADRPDPLTEPECKIPGVDFSTSTSASFSTNSGVPSVSTVAGQPLDANNEVTLVSQSFDVPSAQNCGSVFFQSLNDKINSNLGIPAQQPNNELVFDFKLNFQD
jgi:hypothetical protein